DQRAELAAVALVAGRGDGVRVVLTVLGSLDGPGDRVTLAQAERADHAQRDVDVGRPGQVARRADEGVAVQQVEDAADGDEHVLVGVALLVLPLTAGLLPALPLVAAARATPALAVPAALAVAPATAAAVPVVVEVVVR